MRGVRKSLTPPKWLLAVPVIDRDLKGLEPFPSAAGILLWQRGIRSYDDAVEFLKPDFSRRSDPRALTDMPKAVSRLKEAVVKKERIGIFGDFDHDGISGAVIFSQYLKDLGLQALVVIPDGFTEGHAFREKHLEYFMDQGISIIVTIDVGITNGEVIEKAEKRGIHVIVLDHHILSQGLPRAFAVVDPKREGSPVLLGSLCGAGVAFSCIDATVREGLIPSHVTNSEQYLWRMLDRVAIATIGDMVPMVGDNRILVAQGLEVMRKEPSMGVLALIKTCGVEQSGFTEEDVTFCLVPKINAAARMDHANTAFSVLSSERPEDAVPHIKRLEVSNRKRQQIAERVFLEAVSLVEREEEIPWAIIVGDSHWPQGILGVIASRLFERYHRPVVVFGIAKEVVRASARSIPEFNLIAAMQSCGGNALFGEFGGHAQAAGFSLRADWLPTFKERFLVYAKAHLIPEMLTPVLDISLEVSLHELTPEFALFVQKLAPFGQGNPRPRFLLRNAAIVEIRAIGRNGAWREVTLQAQGTGRSFRAMIDKVVAESVRPGNNVDVVFEFSGRGFYGRIIALRPHTEL